MSESIKCPACANRTEQERLGYVTLDKQAVTRQPPELYRCGACDFLYTVPKLSEKPDG